MARNGVHGWRNAAANIRALSRGPTQAVVRRAHEAGLAPMQSEARANFDANGSRKTGVIPEDLQIVHAGPGTTLLGMTGMGAKLGHFIEFGTAPHEQPNRGTTHPGAAPKPFVRPAFETMRGVTVVTVGGVYGAELQRIAAALRK